MVESLSLYISQILSHALVKTSASIVLLTVEYMIGGFDMVVRALLILLALDFIAGFSVAVRDGNFSRKKFRTGFFKIIIYCLGIATGHWIDIIIFHSPVEFGFKNFIIVYLGINEALSIIRHMASLKVKVPVRLIDQLESYRDNISIGQSKG